jgi:1,3-beta-glucan synthase
LSRTMITGYKKKRLGKPSEKLSGDIPRAGWRAVIVSEVLFPIFYAILLVIAYMFVKSFPVASQVPPSPLIRIAVVSIGPIVWNAIVLLVLFFVSHLGPMLDAYCVRFGAFMATIAHILGTIGMIGFFEFFVRLPLLRMLPSFSYSMSPFSGSSSFGIHHMLSLASAQSWRSSMPFKKW